MVIAFEVEINKKQKKQSKLNLLATLKSLD